MNTVQYDVVGIAEVLVKTFEGQYPYMFLMEELEDQSVEAIADGLRKYITADLADELMETELGQGILLGIISTCELYERARDYEDGQEGET